MNLVCARWGEARQQIRQFVDALKELERGIRRGMGLEPIPQCIVHACLPPLASSAEGRDHIGIECGRNSLLTGWGPAATNQYAARRGQFDAYTGPLSAWVCESAPKDQWPGVVHLPGQVPGKLC
jgi:hypothetical protein